MTKPTETYQENQDWITFWQHYPKQYRALDFLQQEIGCHFVQKHLLYQAITHRSALIFVNNSLKRQNLPLISLPCFERIEFLGDSVLNFVISASLWKKDINLSEGKLSKLRSSLVNETTLAAVAQKINLAQVLTLGPCEEKSGFKESNRVLADILEALVGAIYLDSNIEAAAAFIKRWFYEFLNMQTNTTFAFDYKSKLQEITQEQLKETPFYELKNSFGPDHSKEFEVAVMVKNNILATGIGTTKKRASQDAAKKAFENLDNTLRNKAI